MIAPGTYVVVGESYAWKSFTLHADGHVDFVDACDGHVSAWHIGTWGEARDNWLSAMANKLVAGKLRKVSR